MGFPAGGTDRVVEEDHRFGDCSIDPASEPERRGSSYATRRLDARAQYKPAGLGRAGSRDADFNLRTERLPRLDPAEARRRRSAIQDLSRSRWAVAPPEDQRRAGERPAPSRATEQQTTEEESAEVDASKDVGEGQGVREQPSKPQLDKEQLDYLESVATEPFLSVRQRNERLGLSAWKGGEIKKAALDASLAREVPANPGGRSS